MRATIYPPSRPSHTALADRPVSAPPVRRWSPAPLAGTAGQLALLAVLTVTVGLGPLGWLAGVAFAAGLAVALRGHRLGPADHVTLARASLVGSVTALVADTAGGPLLITLASAALALDAVDGRIARRTGTASPFGARFDMEVDAFLILVLSVLVALSLGLWVLAIGAMRYAFAVAGRALPWLNSPLPPSMARKTVAALQGIALTVTAAGVLPRAAGTAVTGLALAALTWSFARDVVWLHRWARR